MPLVLMNLLIAIISDTFDRVYSSKVASDYREKTELIHEIESIHFWNRNVEAERFLHVIRYKGDQ